MVGPERWPEPPLSHKEGVAVNQMIDGDAKERVGTGCK
jgi:hypothetical protein